MIDIKQFHRMFDPVIIEKFLPYIGHTPFAVYCYYIYRYNVKVGYAYPSLRTTAKHVGCSKNTVTECNMILEHFGLLKILPGAKRLPNGYVPLQPDLGRLKEIVKREFCPL